jgi:hypothetical protein
LGESLKNLLSLGSLVWNDKKYASEEEEVCCSKIIKAMYQQNDSCA